MRERILAIALAWALVCPGLTARSSGGQAPTGPEDVWAPFRFFVGAWEGQGQGGPGQGRGIQTWEFILRGTFLQVRNKAVFDPQAGNPQGEVHEDLGVFSYDKSRKTFVLRQFHVEGFVNQYVLQPTGPDGKTFVFLSEAVENMPPGFQARLTYKILDADTFEQTFDLARPGQAFTCYSQGVMKRQKGAPR